MKRTIATLLILSLTLLCAIPALAEDTTPERELLTSGDWQYYLLEDGGAELCEYTGPAGDIVIPNDLDGHPITAVSENPFWRLSGSYTVAVSQSHPYLATIDGVLFGKTDRSLICYPPSLSAASYEIPAGIRRIGDRAFYRCRGLTAVTIPDSVTSIGDGAFARCIGLTAVTIPDSVTSLGDDAFYNCSSLTAVTIPDSVTSIGVEVFCYCSGLTTVTIPDSVTSIGDSAFAYCSSLTTVTIPDSVTSIEDDAFYQCSSLTAVTIPDSVKSIEGGAFVACEHLQAISVSNDHPSYAAVDGVLFNKDRTVLMQYPAGHPGNEYTIPDSVTSIGDAAFAYCSSLTTVTIPDSVTSVGDGAFYKCSGLTAVTIPEGVTSIGDSAFTECSGLTLSVIAGSYAEQYCIQNNLRYTVIAPDLQDASTDWLTGDP